MCVYIHRKDTVGFMWTMILFFYFQTKFFYFLHQWLITPNVSCAYPSSYFVIKKDHFFLFCYIFMSIIGIICFGIYIYMYYSFSTEVHIIVEELPVEEEQPNESISSIMLQSVNKETVEAEESTLCPICYEQTVECKLQCNHSFCKACLLKVMENKKDLCPYCRQPILYTMQKVISITELQKKEQKDVHNNEK
jgi:hypothetical protein